MRGDLDCSSDDASQVSRESQRGTPPESPAQPISVGHEVQPDSYLDVDNNSVVISHRSSLDVRISFRADPESGHPEQPDPEAQPGDPPATPWLRFLDAEIESTAISGEYYANCMLMILKDYFSSPDPTVKEAVRTADHLEKLNDEFLRGIGSWINFEQRQHMQKQAFLWLLWGALLEIVVRMDYRDDSQDSVGRLVWELLQVQAREPEITGADGRKWTLSPAPGLKSIWNSAYVGFGPSLGFSQPIEATPDEWIACYAFLGRLTGAGLAGPWGLEVWALDDALGDNCHHEPSLKCSVLAATAYIEHAAERLAMTGSEPRGWARSLSLSKWNAWIWRFGEFAKLFDQGPVQWAAWSAMSQMYAIGEKTVFKDARAEPEEVM